jgi:glycolate oxidase iron-sulfur subunit
MQHGQQLRDEPKNLLKAVGFVVKDVPEGHICCGSAGTYNMLQPDLSGRLRERKVKTITRLDPDVIATGNLGCMSQIGKGLKDRGTRIPVVHTVELLDWATGGPKPDVLGLL